MPDVIGSPKVEPDVVEWSKRKRARNTEENIERKGHLITVLVADDNDRYRADLVEFLQTQKGLRIVGEARDAKEALSMARELLPDLVMIDLGTRGISGFEAADKIKNLHPSTKVVFTTIHEKPTYQVLSKYLNADGFVCKSAVKSEIPRLLKRLGLESSDRPHKTLK